MQPEPLVPYRRMPLGYLAVWIGLMALVMLYQYGIPQSVGAWAQYAAATLIGAALWGWICWRFWLYKKFPPRVG